MDKIEFFIRENVGFEVNTGSFENLQKHFFDELRYVKTIKSLNKIYKKYIEAFKSLNVLKPKNPIRVGIVGELYTLMEPFSNYFIEKELAKNKIVVSRYVTMSYILFKKPFADKNTLKETGVYLKYLIGADGAHSVAKARILSEKGYDGIIHIKSFGCTPEVNAMPALQNISKDYKVPIIYFSFDAQTSETGIKTRLEAFYDMIVEKRKKLCKDI